MNKIDWSDEYRENIKKLEEIDIKSIGIGKNTELVDAVCNEICKMTQINSFRLYLAPHKESRYAAYRFRDNTGAICKARLDYDGSGLEEAIEKALGDICDGTCALDILNSSIDRKQTADGNTQRIYYKWGKATKCTIGTWSYNITRVKISEETLRFLLEKYRDSVDNYTDFINKVVCENNVNIHIIPFVEGFNELGINVELHAELVDGTTEEQLTATMFNREDILNLIKANKDIENQMEYRSVEYIQGLGRFIGILIWKIDIANQSIQIKLMDEQVIDIDEREITCNHAICSKIEQQVAIKAYELDSIFGEGLVSKSE